MQLLRRLVTASHVVVRLQRNNLGLQAVVTVRRVAHTTQATTRHVAVVPQLESVPNLEQVVRRLVVVVLLSFALRFSSPLVSVSIEVQERGHLLLDPVAHLVFQLLDLV